MNLRAMRNKIERLKGEKEALERQLSKLKADLQKEKRSLEHTKEAQNIIITVAKATQDEFQVHVNSLVTTALKLTFGSAYSFEIDFVQRRNKTEADIYFVHSNGNRISPLDAAGGGAVDIAAFALRLALISLMDPAPRQTLVLDEPFRFLSLDLRPKAAQMLKELSEKLGLQFIIVTHSSQLTEYADCLFEFWQNENGITAPRATK
jgi:DNA repair exonuclease SbcCD ATPase subunit